MCPLPMTVPCLLRCLPTRSPQSPVPHFASWKITRNFLARRKTHRTCLPCWVPLRDGPLAASCKTEEMGGVTSASSRASVSGVGHLFSPGKEPHALLSPFPLGLSLMWRKPEVGPNTPFPLSPPLLQAFAPAAGFKELSMCSVTWGRTQCF